MRCKLLVALQLKVPHHFIERVARGRAGRIEDPGAFGATKTPKTLLFNPYQLPIHGGPRGCGLSLSEPMPSSREWLVYAGTKLTKFTCVGVNVCSISYRR